VREREKDKRREGRRLEKRRDDDIVLGRVKGRWMKTATGVQRRESVDRKRRRAKKKKSSRGQALADEHKLLRGFTANEDKAKKDCEKPRRDCNTESDANARRVQVAATELTRQPADVMAGGKSKRMARSLLRHLRRAERREKNETGGAARGDSSQVNISPLAAQGARPRPAFLRPSSTG
jgi:hypothetical protein